MKFPILTTTALLLAIGLATPASAASLRDIRNLVQTNSCTKCDLSGVQLNYADLRNANLRDADLRNADLRGANLRNANLRNADLRGAYLDGANLEQADLRGAALDGANLRNANLRNANLRDIDFRNAYLDGANLNGTIVTQYYGYDPYDRYDSSYQYDPYYRYGSSYQYDPYYRYGYNDRYYRYGYNDRYYRQRYSYDDINRIYREVLGRDADRQGLITWSDRLSTGRSLNDIRRDIANSPEARSAVNQIYREVLGREADSRGLSTWTNRLASGDSLTEIRRQIERSEEARDRIGSNTPVRIQPISPIYQQPIYQQRNFNQPTVPLPNGPVRIQPIQPGGNTVTDFNRPIERTDSQIEIRRRRSNNSSTSEPVRIQPIAPVRQQRSFDRPAIAPLPAPAARPSFNQPGTIPSGPVRIQPIQ